MAALYDNLPWIATMALLIAVSAFFSGSEAALFSLRGRDRRALKSGSPAQRLAARLLTDPDRLLSAVLFWNLVVNVAYFAIASIVGLQLSRTPEAGKTVAAAFAFAALLSIIFFSEMLPKSVAVLAARPIAALVSVPLAGATRAVDPLMPALRTAMLLSRRLLWPGFKPEMAFEVADLERAIGFSTDDAALVEQEQIVLRNMVTLSEVRVDEWMRPRMHFIAFRPPVALADLEGKIPPGGYVLVTEDDSDEVVAAVPLASLYDVPREHLEFLAEPVVYVPWCTTVAQALQQMQQRDREVAVVINEFGETVGILTVEDLLDTIFSYHPERNPRLLSRESIVEVRSGVWRVTGMMSLRRLARRLQFAPPPSRSMTVGGLLQEVLQRLPEEGDECVWGPLHLKVIEAPQRGQLLVELTPVAPPQEGMP